MFAKCSDAVLLVSGVVNASGNTAGTYFPADYDDLIFFLNVTAHSGTTPTLDVKYQISPDDGVTWYDQGSAFAQVTTTDGRSVLKIPNGTGRLGRLVYTLGGTSPSYTFELRMHGKKTGGVR